MLARATLRPEDVCAPGRSREASSRGRRSDRDAPQLPLHALAQQRSAIIRPLGLWHDRTAIPRAHETDTHPETVGALTRRLDAQGMLGLLPASRQVIPAGRRRRVPDEVVADLQRLTGLYDGLGSRELARSLLHPGAYRISPQSGHKLWHHLPPASPQQLPLLDSQSSAERSQARRQVMARSCHGWSTRRLSRFLHVSRPPINAWSARCEADNTASLEDKSRAPLSPRRKAWLPAMVAMSHRPKRPPDAGGCRIWRRRGNTDLSVRTVERLMALNRQVYQDIPGVGRQRHTPTAPHPHPFKATAAHEDWGIDGRMMDCALAGVTWWSGIVLDG